MPRPHYPAQGGSRHAFISRLPALTTAPQSPNHAATAAPADDRERQTLRAEVERLQRELERAKSHAPAPRASDAVRSFWIAAALCVGSLLFALMALWRRI